MTVYSGASVVTPDGVLPDGWVSVSDGVITAVGTGPVDGPSEDLGGGFLVPGFIDLHVHGGGGYDFTAGPDELAAAVAFHRSQGTTRTLVSLVTAPIERMCEQLRWIAALADAGGSVLGAHLEGPFLSHVRCGAQHPDHLLTPDPLALAELLKAGQGHVRAVTVAPELPGGLDLIERLVDEGVVAAVGHTDGTYAEATAGFARGATLLTHAFNGMRPLHHREPGPVAAALDAGVTLEVINDGVHLHPGTVRLVAHGRLALVTDAIDAAGKGDGRYVLGGQDVVVSGREARLARDGALAGSTLTMGGAFRNAVREVGMTIERASRAASGEPARVLGIADRCGSIAVGFDADLVLVDDDLEVRRVMSAGGWV
ncbi:N-acetylglucosamine-6-phosphate deacetylase [Virgisporangium ochraceum]|uniref:N-acetylglucosamine-6-phosphate deacetylase n=1 Tax=Virgisporangium ochraceum TaxID=65505 RepID=A0A8J3ZVS9_9ACTN|nr:N-acetylglucosamine-6-phosphate deacetylase [Virgisporangium ochraceum]GIJ69053.1 N-acetylglucosamine-6-phosphate deacetylase [Virgisporangium ochraceum]